MEEELEAIIKIQSELIDQLYMKLVEHEVLDRSLVDKMEDIARRIYENGIDL